jgi:KaiC/GvpD/RAD55 family RecA-like ATPase
MSEQDQDASARLPAPEPSFPLMPGVEGYSSPSGGSIEAHDIYATNVVSGSQYIHQQTIYQGAGNRSLPADSLVALTAFIVEHAPSWLISLRHTILDGGREAAVGVGKEFAHRIFPLDEKEQLRHLEQALKNAAERGLAPFDLLQPRDLRAYKEILRTLSQPGSQGKMLRHEIMQLLTLSATPDLVTLTDTYNRCQRLHNVAHQDIDAAPYLRGFFAALVEELYADVYFRPQLSDVLCRHVANGMQQSLLNVVGLLKRMGETLEKGYSAEDFAHDVAVYTTYTERMLHNLKIVAVVPKDQKSDPELSGIFVPLRIASSEQAMPADQQPDTIVTALEQSSHLVLLGGPGSGKSTATKHLAWSHAASQSTIVLTHTPLLSGNPLPLHIELRRLREERKRTNHDFLSFVTEVILKRGGVEINPQMFKELLTRRCMLLLFDGLDEVATLSERLELVGEIERFALCYPGNRVLVTSRPVGYDLARLSHPLFSHAQIQDFNDEQIQQFLENWYSTVLRLSPIPPWEREELDLLVMALKENPRLHKLAENPLLLTVITALHRYERLPDRRVLIYDRCANLLLETWVKLKGMDERWKDMKTVKEDQYACVANLGFVLHERSQEETSQGDEEAEARLTDVSSRFLRKNVEDFLRRRKLIVGVAEQRAEAKRFIALVQEEAGLIVERGTDENGEALYGFVHLTFQEYFAAADVYERYQQKEDPKVVSRFLAEHLHDPYWREVIFLLLGKLRSTPVTNQLRQILQGKMKSRRSQYTEIMQQDLFFVCDCLLEEIKVENSLLEAVKSHLSSLVKDSPFPSQRREALEHLGELMKTRQYADQGRKELITFATKDDLLEITTRLEALQVLYLNSTASSKERQVASRTLTNLLQRPDLPVDQAWQTAALLYQSSVTGSEKEQLATSMLTSLRQRPDLPVDQAWQTAASLYRSSSIGSEEEQLAISMLTSLLQRPDLPVDQAWRSAASLYQDSAAGSEEKQLATFMLIFLLERPDLPVDQTWQTATSLYRSSLADSEEKRLATSMLLSLLQHPDLSIDQALQATISLYQSSRSDPEERLFMSSILLTLLSRAGTPKTQEDAYHILRLMIPQFHKLPLITGRLLINGE